MAEAIELTGDITEVIQRAQALKSEPGVNKKAINKTIGRLEEAWIWSMQIPRGDSLASPENLKSLQNKACICPEGAIDTGCPVHGG